MNKRKVKDITVHALSRLEQLKEKPPVASAPPIDDIIAQIDQLPTPSKVNPNVSGKGNSRGTAHTFPRGTTLLHIKLIWPARPIPLSSFIIYTECIWLRGKGLATLANELRQSGFMRFVWLFALCKQLRNATHH